jgi:hypothetical protein
MNRNVHRSMFKIQLSAPVLEAALSATRLAPAPRTLIHRSAALP